ncbi:Cbb3-type cytochrome c oxidase subunit CcoP [Polymorphobacter multimanifer]|uniref:cytochrome-c oxidase, cbb3-type subunit III n=1 Tax=Polymorphobacter multimanifer TaxID=1070431 RepID=UPI00166E1EAE|nr:cytochrome-c oxidase, cbb3-type subunit III [Polymorphobacter multimanifer]GGI72261.1 Cbb3-type cytochrome c oxidase subunit CcoP [Polymorphobacter multimanifer]
MAHKHIDEATGTPTVGHEWDGIAELDTPLPRWWLITFILCIVLAVGYVIFYPAIPLANPATPGTLGWSSRGDLAKEMAADTSRRAPVFKAIAITPLAQLPANPALLAQAIEGGRAAFKVHCVQCHGAGAAGSVGYPNLNDDDWLWGGDLGAIEHTLINGIRNPDYDETRNSQMPAFGEILGNAEIEAVITHVRSLSGLEKPSLAGATVFADNCAACHGENGKGYRDLGAPNIADSIWLYGGDRKTLKHTITYARGGVMPRWNARLNPVTIKMLAAYVHSLGGGEAGPPPVPAEVAEASTRVDE